MMWLRLGIIFLGTIGGLYGAVITTKPAFSSADIIEISGPLNIWGSYTMLLVLPYIAIYTVKEAYRLKLNIGDIRKVGLLLMLVVAPSISIGVYGQSKANVSNYVECKDERKVSSRYSSRTYAIDDSLCDVLQKND